MSDIPSDAKRAETISKLQDSALKAIDRAAAYTVVVVALGYGACFTVWSFTRTQLPDRTNLYIAALLLISLTIFIGFEVFKMLTQSRYHVRLANFLVADPAAATFDEELAALRAYEFRSNSLIVTVWSIIIWPCILTGFAGGILLGYNLFATMFGWSRWPA